MDIPASALVYDTIGSDEAIVKFHDRTEEVAEIRSQQPNVGDAVWVESQLNDLIITDIIDQDGHDSGKSLAIIRDVLEDDLVVEGNGGIFTIDKPDQEINQGYLIEVRFPQLFSRIVSTDPDNPEDYINTPAKIEFSDRDDDDVDWEADHEEIEDENYAGIGGLDQVLETVREVVELPLESGDLLEEIGVQPPKGILFFGPPGTGKTMVAKAVANETDSRFFTINGPEIVGKYYGQSEERIRDIFNQAKESAPSIIFIDEIESIAPRRGQTDDTERRIVAQLLTMMQGIEKRGDVVVIGATNFPKNIDTALRRPGRFDEEIRFDRPNDSGRQEILKIVTEGMNLSSRVDLDEIVRRTNGWTGADLDSLLNKSGVLAAKDNRDYVTQEDVLIAYEQVEMKRSRKQQQIREIEEHERQG